MAFPERFHHFCPENGKKADLMFAQHMLAVLRPEGMMATVMPHGVLFRGGVEATIRRQFIERDHLEAVIGLPPNLFYGTGIPACILIMRNEGAKPPARRGKVLFINADAEYHAGRAQNYLRPEHIEKIVSTFERFADVPGYAAVVTKDELAANGYNCNIRRYADNAPPPEAHDVRAHLIGGVPKAEVQAARESLFDAHGFDPTSLFVERAGDDRYLDFAPVLTRREQIKVAIEANTGVKNREARLADALAGWWKAHEARLLRLPDTHDPMAVRAGFLESFAGVLAPVGLLDRFKVDGVIASWWNEVQFNLQTLASVGFEGLLDGWVLNIESALKGEEGVKVRLDSMATNNRLLRLLVGNHLDTIAAAEARKDELEARVKALQPKKAGEDDEAAGEEGDEAEEPDAEELELTSEDDLKALKRELTQAKRELKALKTRLADEVTGARKRYRAETTERLVLDILRAELEGQLERYVAQHRRQVVGAVENVWDKYRVSLRDIEAKRGAAEKRLTDYLAGLGYAS